MNTYSLEKEAGREKDEEKKKKTRKKYQENYMMNPYQVLGISPGASDDEIKKHIGL